MRQYKRSISYPRTLLCLGGYEGAAVLARVQCYFQRGAMYDLTKVPKPEYCSKVVSCLWACCYIDDVIAPTVMVIGRQDAWLDRLRIYRP